MAIGSNNAHSNTRRPGKRHMVVIHAVSTPPKITPAATPSISNNELVT